MAMHIANAIRAVESHTSAEKVNCVGASIIARPPLTGDEIEAVEGIREVTGRKLVHRPDQSDEDRTWFDLKKR